MSVFVDSRLVCWDPMIDSRKWGRIHIFHHLYELKTILESEYTICSFLILHFWTEPIKIEQFKKTDNFTHALMINLKPDLEISHKENEFRCQKIYWLKKQETSLHQNSTKPGGILPVTKSKRISILPFSFGMAINE